MDDQRLDELTKRLAQPISRRQVLLSLLGAIFGGLFVQRGSAASSSCTTNPACAYWCEAVFGFGTPAALQCIRDVAHCTGLCYS